MSLLDSALENAKVIYSLKQENDVGYTNTSSYSYKTLSFLDDTQMSLEDKKDNLLNVLKGIEANENKLWIEKRILDHINNVMTSYRYWENKNGWRAIKNICDYCSGNNFWNKDMYNLVELLMKKTFEQDISYFDKFKTKFFKLQTSLSNVQQPKYQNSDGTWTTYYENWNRFSYHTHPRQWDKTLAEKNKKSNESLKGFEYEGSFSTRKDFIECMDEMHETDFLGGKLYDERNFFMPTEDGSLNGNYCVEFWLCPMSTWFAKQFYKKFLEILKKHNWESSSEINNSGIHCHLDANMHNQKTLKKLVDVVYDMDDNEKLQLYQRDGRDDNAYNNWDKDCCYDEANRFVKTDEKNKDGEPYYLSKRILTANCRRTLLNLEHLRYNQYDSEGNTDYEKPTGTLELRGFNSKVNILDIIDKIDNMVAQSLS